MPAFVHTFGGFQYLGVILVTAIPFGIYDLIEALVTSRAPPRRRQLSTTRLYGGGRDRPDGR